MSSHATLFLIGIFLAVLPFLGLPRSLDSAFIAVAGAACFVIAFVVRSERARALRGALKAEGRAEVFVEARPKRARRTRPRSLSDVIEPRDVDHVTAPAVAEAWPNPTPDRVGLDAAQPPGPASVTVGADAPAIERADFPREHEPTTVEASV
ncbi:MAG: hypothetical protein Q8R39_02660 [bacterium]|nr:hypothetical protein [bacterium]MDZ4284886.1 hypothetical protein [Patescibacteria group bacterium]